MSGKLIAENRRARFDYFLEETFEAGISLTGSEVKSLRLGKANIAESYASADGDQITLVNAYIPEYGPASTTSHAARAGCCCTASRSTSCWAPFGATAARSSPPASTGTKRAWPSSNWPWPKASPPPTSARPRRRATGNANRAG
jgi:hypothetical protein